MRNFLLFISRFFNLILFIGLEIVCAVLISRTNTIQGNDLLNSSNALSGFLYKRQNALVYYFSLGAMNDSLLSENNRLRSELAQSKYSFDPKKDSNVLQELPERDTSNRIRYAKYIYRTARVINNTVGQRDNYITLNRGADDGIRKEMAVISGSGIVGKVVHTSAHFSTVLSVLSSLQEVSVHLKDSTTGIARWLYERRTPTPDIIYMSDVPREILLHKGDTVWTTTFSFFPPEIMVGTITNVEIVRKTGKRLLSLKPATDFRKMMYVYVVENTFQTEQKSLETQNNSSVSGTAKGGKKK